MCYRKLFIIFVGWLILIASVPADIVWSGTQYQRAYHDISSLDFNQDGTNDFTFNEVVIDSPVAIYREIFIEASDGRVIVDSRFDLAASLPAGTIIASSLDSSDHVWEGDETFLFGHGIIDGIQDYGGLYNRAGYLGISFKAEGSTHYGWIELSHDEARPFPENNSLMIHGWAWETEADTAIIAGAIPEPSSGILTMIGTLSLLQLARSRRRRKQIHKPIFGYHRQQAVKEPEQW